MKALMLTWMFQNALLGGGLLTVGCLLAARCRSPVRTLRILDWTLVAALSAPMLASTQGPWRLPLRCLPAPQPAPASTTTTVSSLLQAAPVLANPAFSGHPVLAGYERRTGGVRAAALHDARSEAWNWPDWRDVLLLIEAVVIALLAAKWLVSALALACLSYSAKALDAGLVARIGEQLPKRLRPPATIRLDRNVSTPCVFGLFRPCILLPEFLLRADRFQQMIFALAHESSHILRGDLWSWRLVRVGQFALWFQPAYWWLRRQTRLCQDFLADFDATMVGKATDLADFLVQLARLQQTGEPRGQTPFPAGPAAFFFRKRWWLRAVLAEKVSVPPAALSMRSRRTDLFWRVNMLLHPGSQLEYRCPPRFQAVLAVVVFSIIGIAGVLRLEAQDRTTESRSKVPQALPGLQSDPANVMQVHGRVLGPDGKPVSGAKLYLGAVSKDHNRHPVLRFYEKGMESALRATSDADGHFGFTFSNAELLEMVREDLTRMRFPDLVGEVMGVAPGHGCGWSEIDGAARELTIHLVDDFPVTGRILDGDGHPVAAARISLTGIGAAPREDLNALLKAVQKDEGLNLANACVQGGLFSKVWNGSLPGQPAITTTGRDGRFRLSGIGRDRLVGICIEGPSIATDSRWVMTRTGETVKLGNWWPSIFAASFDFVGRPSRLITGTVRNQATGRPVAGVSVGVGGSQIRSVTDHNGRYELRGASKGPTYQLVAAPGDGLFFERAVKLQDTPGLDSLRCDIELVSWLTVHGRVTEKETGRPVAGAWVDYYPLAGNRYVNKLLDGRWWPCSETTASLDGSYTLTVMPGPGVIAVRGVQLNAYAPAVATVQERKHFFKSPLAPFNNDDDRLDIALGGSETGAIFVNYYDAVMLIEPGEEERAVVRDVALQRPQELRGRVLGPDSQPLTGTTVSGLGRFGHETLPGSDFTVRGVNPKGKRSLVFYHRAKQLGYYLKDIDTRSGEPLTVKLQPCGSVSGRILDEDGQPVAGAQVYVMGNTLLNGSEEGGGYHRVATDANGRFHIVGLVAGQEYEFSHSDADITVEAGQNKDFGDIKMTRRGK